MTLGPLHTLGSTRNPSTVSAVETARVARVGVCVGGGGVQTHARHLLSPLGVLSGRWVIDEVVWTCTRGAVPPLTSQRGGFHQP